MKFQHQLLESISSFYQKNKWLLYSCLVNLIIQVIVAVIYYNPVDFVLQIETAREIAQGKLLYRDIHQIEHNNSLLPNPQYPPLYLYTVAGLIFIVGTNTFTFNMAKMFLISVNFLVSFVIYYLIREEYGKKMAILAFNWFMLNPSTLGITLGGYHENYMILFVLIAFLFVKQNRIIRSGICFGLALLVKPIAGIMFLPLAILGVKERIPKPFFIGGIAGLTFLIVSLPFLILAPNEFIADVFLIHAERLDPSMSFYVYILTDLSPTFFPFLVQFLLFSAIGVILYRYIDFKEHFQLYLGILPFTTIFLAFNRILYPHYIPIFFPFFTIILFYLINQYKHEIKKGKIQQQIIFQLLGLILVYIGYIWWSLLWSVEGFETYKTNIFFPVSATLCISGLLIIAISSLWVIITTANNKKRVYTNVS
jgi:uncharacterized membrane protein